MENLVDISLLFATIRISTPLVLGALSGLFSERSGVVNIAIEGMMMVGAFFSALAAYYTGNPWIGVGASVLAGGLMALLHAVASVTFKANQIVAGTAVNIISSGLCIFLLRTFFNNEANTPSVKNPLGVLTIPFTQISFNPIVYVSIILVLLSWIVLYKTPLGLRIRTVGEHPKAADTVGVNVYTVRYFCVIISGMFAGLAGAHLAIGEGVSFVKGMTAGRGFIALTAMIFGKWNPIGAFFAALLFGFADAFQTSLGNSGVNIPAQFIQMIPYAVTIFVLAGFVGKANPPAAVGIPYEKGER